jgi:hypothetical protein
LAEEGEDGDSPGPQALQQQAVDDFAGFSSSDSDSDSDAGIPLADLPAPPQATKTPDAKGKTDAGADGPGVLYIGSVAHPSPQVQT